MIAEKYPNLKLARDLVFSDIVDNNTFPIDIVDQGKVFCYDCDKDENGIDHLEPLTPSSGVFTSLVLCGQGAPVYLCLRHIRREVFSPELISALNAVHVS